MNYLLPEMNVSDERDEVVVRIKIPGINEKNVELNVRDNFLNVNVSEKSEKKIKDKNYVANEWAESSFTGSVSLPSKVAPMLVHHSYDGKVLEVRLKKV